MNLSELYAEVILITKRPDLVARTESAVRAAIVKLHRTDFYAKDLVEVAIQFNTVGYLQSLEPKLIIPQYRQIKYFRVFDGNSTGQPVGPVFTNIQVENILDGYGYQKSDVFYMSGQLLQIRSSVILKFGIIGAYVDPVVINTGFKSWIADEYPMAVVYEAARNIFGSIGYLEQAREMQTNMMQELGTLKLSSLDTAPF